MAFDDLIPKPGAAAGLFDDLIPPAPAQAPPGFAFKPKSAARGAFDDLIPADIPESPLARVLREQPSLSIADAQKVALNQVRNTIPGEVTESEAFWQELRERAGMFPSRLLQWVPDTIKTAGVLGGQLSRFAGATPEEANPDADPLVRTGRALERAIAETFPTPENPDLSANVVGGAGQIAGMIIPGKLLGLGAKGMTTTALAGGGVQEFQDAFERSRARGDDPDTAFAKSLGYATVASLIEARLGVGRILRQYFPDPNEAVRVLSGLGLSRQLIGNFVAGGLEEGSQRWAQNLIVEGQPSLEGVMDEALPGAIVQGLVSGPGTATPFVQQQAEENAWARLLQDTGRRMALEESIPDGAAVVREAKAPRQSAAVGLFDDLIPSESQPSQPAKTSDSLGLVQGPGGKTSAETATPAAPLATRPERPNPVPESGTAEQIRAGLASLPGAEQDLKPATLTPEERAQPVTRGDIEDLKNVLERNQMQPRPVEDAIKPQETAQRERFTQFSKRIQAGDQAALTEAKSARDKGEISEDHFRALQEAADNAGQPINRLPTKADVQERADNTVLEALQEHGALGGPELESAMRQMNAGRSAADIAAEYGGEYDALANILETIHEARRSRKNNNQANLLKRAYERARLGGNAKGVDQVLAGMQTAQAEGRGVTGGLPTDTNDLIARAWDEAVRHEESQGRREEVSPAERQLERDAAFAEDSAQPGARRQAVVADQLEPGDRLKINGADLQVQRVERTADSGEVEAVQFANGDRYGTQSVEGTRVLHVDKDSWSGEGQRRHETRTQQADTDRTKAGERALARLQAQRPGLRLRLTRGGTGWDAHPSQGKPVGGVRQRLDSTIRELIEQAFSIRIHLVESADGSIVPFNGVHLPGTRDVLIARDAEKPLLAVAFHEIGETMRTTHPGLYRELVEALTPLMRDFPEYAARIRAAQKKLGRELSDFDARAELVNDFLGDMSTRPEFWDRLAAENPSVFKRTARIVLQWLDRALEKLHGLGITSFNRDRYFTDIEQARDIVHAALNRFVADSAGAGAPGQEQFSARDEFAFDAPESVADQEARQVREKEQGARSKEQARMLERAGQRLTSDDDTRTMDMFGGSEGRATRQDKSGQGALFSAREDKPLWRDNIQDALATWQNKGTREQLLAHLQKTRGAMDQAEWIGMDEFLKDKPSVTREQVLEFVRANRVDVQEVEKGIPADLDARLTELFDKEQSGTLTDAEFAEQEHLQERVKGTETQFSQYQLPGGENYRELLLTLPEKPLTEADIPKGYHLERMSDGEYTLVDEKTGVSDRLFEKDKQAAIERIFTYRKGGVRPNQKFSSPHFDEPNILAHVRFNERTDADGKRVLFIEEVQSDWHQKGRKEGYGEAEGERNYQAAHKQLLDEARQRSGIDFSEDTNPAILGGHVAVSTWEAFRRAEQSRADETVRGGKVPNAPFKQTWPMLAMKRMIRYAAENGFDRLAWTTGEQQAERYDLSKQVEFIRWGDSLPGSPNATEGRVKWVAIKPKSDSTMQFAVDKDGKVVDPNAYIHRGPAAIDGKPLADVVGKEIAEKILTTHGEVNELREDGLKIGGEGMKGFYDRMLPSEVNKFVKKWGGKVGQAKIGSGDAPQFIAGSNPPNGQQVEARIKEIRAEWDGPRRTAAGWQRWNVNLDRQAEMLLHNMASGNGYALAMQNSGSIELADKLGLGGEWSAEKQHSKVHSLDITPEMRAAALEGMPLFSAKEGEQPERADAGVWAAFRSAETRLKLMRLEQERTAAMSAAQTSGDWSQVQALNAQMDDVFNAPDPKSSRVNVDVPRSKEETAALIADTVNVLNAAQDAISNFKVKSQTIPADLTQLRNDLTARLKLLKGWADDAAELAAVGQRAATTAPAGSTTRQRQMELEAATDPQQRTWGEWWASVKQGLRYLTSPIPELPLTGERAEKSALFRRGYRLFATENTRVKAEAAAKIQRVLEPLTKLGRQPEANRALRDYYQLGTRLARLRAAGETARADAVAKRMAELEERSLNKDPFNLFRRLVLYRDLWWRGTFLKNEQGKPIALPNGLTVDEVAAELRRITQAIEQHPNGLAIVEAAKRHYELTEELQQSILAHGEIIPEALRNPLYFPHHIIDSWSGRLDRVKPTTEEDFRRYLIAPVGSGKLIQSDYLKAMFLHTADVLAHNARVDLVEKYWKPYDISDRLKAEHGEAWNKPWNLPPGYRLFTPYTKLPLRMDYILSREVLADKLGVLFNDGDLRARMGDAGKVLKVKPEDLHAALVAGEKIQWALPVEIADALDGIAKREKAMANPGLGHTIGLPVRKAVGFWKMTKLFAPWNWIRYEYGNLSTDAIDKVLAADPGAAKYLARAAREVWQADQPGEKTPEFKAASREGVFDTITAGEAGDLAKLPDFQEFLTPGEKRWENVKSFLARPMRGSKFREATFRYAKFLADVERLRAGQEPVYGGAFHGDIEALGETTEGQKKMLEGDELVFAKAAEISLKTYGDYNSLGVAGQWLRQYAIPFWSWQDVNFRYHANQLRNLADGLMGIRGGTPHTAALRYAGIRVVSTLLAVGIAKELWNQFGGPALGLWDDDDDLEAKLSAQDRRRGHLLLGKDKNGQAMVVYTPSALSDIAEWTGGQNMKRLFLEWMRGQITLEQFVSDYAKQLPNDVLNKLAQSVGPVGKAPYEAISGKSTFPDITDQRSIPSSERWWRLVGNLTDDRAVGWLRGVFDRDYYSQPAAEQLQQIILQIRRRDAEQWAYYETREHAADWKEARTGKRFEAGSYDAPEAMALRNFRKAIYRGDVAAAERFYGRLLEYGYTAQRLDASIRAQSPLADLNKAEQKEYLATLNERDRAQLQLAEQYYARIKALDGREKRLFPKKGGTPRPNPELLREIVEGQSRNK